MSTRIDTLELKQIIMQVVDSIPKGKVTSYGQVAKLCGYSGYGRYVGSVLKQLPHNTSLKETSGNVPTDKSFSLPSNLYLNRHLERW